MFRGGQNSFRGSAKLTRLLVSPRSAPLYVSVVRRVRQKGTSEARAALIARTTEVRFATKRFR